jgi:ribosomal protein S18 acetylase RimI-like enzyme
VPRPPVVVREGVPDDLPDLLALWREARAGLGHRGRAVVPEPSDEAVLGALARARAGGGLHVDVAVLGAAVVGVLVAGAAPAGVAADLLGRPPVLEVACLHVREGCRRQGVGHALLARAAQLADAVGAGEVVVDVPSQDRDAQRWFARQGVGPALVRRAVAVPALRRALVPPERSPALDGLLARRRTARPRRPARPVGWD